eukprot:SAG31_NODE_3961_length_3709_cov_7.355721_1_plen_82_part_00
MEHFDEFRFRRRVDESLVTARKFLHTTRAPVLAEDVPHEYTDKFLLAEFVTSACISAVINALELVGVRCPVDFKKTYYVGK